MSKFLFYLGHPAHFHNIKIVAQQLVNDGHQVLLVAREKDVLFKLLENSPFEIIFLPPRKPGGTLKMVMSILNREKAMFSICRKFKPDLLAGTDLVITHIGKLLQIPSIIINEDDAVEIPLMAKLAFPFATAILAPNCCDQSPYEHKKIGYNGYHELAYLHPDYFTPDKSLFKNLINTEEPYFILRFAQLSAHHDKGKQGISDKLAQQIIALLSEKGKVYITSERPLSQDLEKYRVQVHPSLMHHVMAFAEMYIGDSQTMAAEAAVLGVPSIRYNDFVGRLGYLEELQHKFELTIGIPTTKKDELIKTITFLLSQPELKLQWQRKRLKMINETTDVVKFWTETLLQFSNKS